MAKEDIKNYSIRIAQKILEENKGKKVFKRNTRPKKKLSG